MDKQKVIPREKGFSAGKVGVRGFFRGFFLSEGITIPQTVVVPDVSFYDDPTYFDQMAAKISGVIVRAGQNLWPDTSWNAFWPAAKQAGLKRGCYWFYDSRAEPTKQADKFWGQFASDMPEMEIIADYEEFYNGTYKGVANLKIFVERLLSKGIPKEKMAIYTGYYYWKDYGSTDPYWKQFKLHLAWYNLAQYVSVPAPWTEEDLLFWQFTESGPSQDYGVYGSKALDLNYFNGTLEQFNARYNVSIPPPVEPPPAEPPGIGETMGKTICTNGVTIEEFEEYGCKIHAMTVPPEAIDIASFYYSPDHGELAENLINNDLKIFWNFGPYDPPTGKVNTGLKIEGKEYRAYVNYNPWISWSGTQASISHVAANWRYTYSANQGWRYVIDKTAKNAVAVNDPNRPEWNDRVARRIVCQDVSGNTVIFSSEGSKPGKEGLTLHEVAAILLNWQQNGHGNQIYNAIDGDSGHSVQTAYVLDSKKVLFSGCNPEDRNLSTCYGFFRLKEPLVAETTTEPPVEPPPVEPPAEPAFPDEIIVRIGEETKSYDPRV